MPRLIVVLCCIAALCGCAATTAPRTADGSPPLERLTPQDRASLVPTTPPRLSLDEIVGMSKGGTPPSTIIDRIYQTGARFALTDAQRAALRSSGVSEVVVAYIDSYEADARRIDAATRQADAEALARAQRNAIVAAPAYPYYAAPRVYPYGGYGWGPYGSGWRAGVGFGF